MLTDATTSVGLQILDRMKQRGADKFWRVGDFLDLCPKPRTIDRALLRLSDAGEIQRVHHGLFWRGRHTAFGMTRPDDFLVALRLADVPGVGLAGLSAANELGLTTQVPGRVHVAVPRRPPSSPSTVRFIDRTSRRDRVTQRLSPTEVAVLEVLGDWHDVVDDLEDARRRLHSVVRSDAVRPSRLVAASETEPMAVRVALKTLLADAGRKDLAAEIRTAGVGSPVLAGCV